VIAFPVVGDKRPSLKTYLVEQPPTRPIITATQNPG
jgi:hypothetical protein